MFFMRLLGYIAQFLAQMLLDVCLLNSSESPQNSKPPISPIGNSTCVLHKKMTNCANTTMASAEAADPPLS